MDKRNKKILYRIIITILLFLITIVCIELLKMNINDKIILGIYILIYFIIGYDILFKACRNVFLGDFLDENFLMSIASVCAFFVSEYTEAIAVMLLYQIGELFQRIAVNKSRKSIADLVDICPECANVVGSIDSNDEEIIDSEDVEIGTLILIKVGERVPLDCIVVKGESLVDVSALTGESVPIKVGIGNELLSGSINTSNVIIAKTIKEYQDSTATKILELVENASDKKSRSENFITKFAKYYTPIVVGMALFIAIIPPLIIEGTWSDWIGRACIFLITSCPCALVISVPLSFFGGIGAASKKGILVKGSNYLEALSKVDTCVFDKTGTLTKGDFKVCDVYINEEFSKNCANAKEMFWRLVYNVEKYSNHPIAKAIISYTEDNALQCDYKEEYDFNTSDISEIAGKGIVASNDKNLLCVGNKALMDVYDVKDVEECTQVGTVVYVSHNNKFLGYILIKDELKEFSKTLIGELYNIGISQTVMLTGDKMEVGEDIASRLNLSKVYAQLYPNDKVSLLEDIMTDKVDKGTTLYVGDGINDAPVLARADIGISMGGVASDAAIEASDIVLMDDNLLKILDAIRISRKTMIIVRQNIVFSLAVKALVLILGVIGMANMWMAIFADVGVMVIAILNAIRVNIVKIK